MILPNILEILIKKKFSIFQKLISFGFHDTSVPLFLGPQWPVMLNLLLPDLKFWSARTNSFFLNDLIESQNFDITNITEYSPKIICFVLLLHPGVFFFHWFSRENGWKRWRERERVVNIDWLSPTHHPEWWDWTCNPCPRPGIEPWNFRSLADAPTT